MLFFFVQNKPTYHPALSLNLLQCETNIDHNTHKMAYFIAINARHGKLISFNLAVIQRSSVS